MGKKIVAMILAGGKGTRLHELTEKVAKPAVSFGGKYRIIDFPLSNCANSGINTVGVLTQYESVLLDEYIGNGEKWGLNGVHSLTTTLAPRQTDKGMAWYTGTANAIYENLEFLESTKPDYVLILSGDHIYSTTFRDMAYLHEETKADLTIAVYPVPWDEAHRFGILVTDKKGQIVEFQEKPANPISNLASMGIYMFKYDVLKDALERDAKNEKSEHDFGKNVIPMLLGEGKKLMAYKYEGYWKDVGTVSSLHEANMDLLPSSKDLSLEKIFNGNVMYSEDNCTAPHFVSKYADIKDSLINQGALIYGTVKHSVISNEVYIERGALVENSVVMAGAEICKGAVVRNAVIGPGAFVKEGKKIEGTKKDIALFVEKEEK